MYLTISPAVAASVELDRDELAHALLLHRHAIEEVRDFDRPLVVGDDQELRLLGELLHDLVEAADIGIVEGSVDLVQQEEGRWPHLEDRDEQSHGREGLLPS